MGVDGGPVGMPADEVVPLPRLANRSLVAGTKPREELVAGVAKRDVLAHELRVVG